jgi:myo-inositol-1(or 4)-monophosphatase
MSTRESAVAAIAASGSELAAERFRTAMDVETKSSKVDPVTAADRRTQAHIVDRIESAFPDDTVVGEEDDALKTLPGKGTAWIVDPIDGTLNYSRGIRTWVTSVTVVEDGDPVGAANVAPALGDTYVATADSVTLNDTPISVSDNTDPEGFLVASTLRLQTADHGRIGQVADRIIERFGEFRRIGSAQLTLSLVASGALDAVVGFEAEPQPWDTVGGVYHVRQAGGTVTDLDGDRWEPGGPGLVASNGRCHDAVQAVADKVRVNADG